MSVATRDLFLSERGTKLVVETVPMPELGDGVVAYVRGMSGAERDTYQASMLNQKGRRSTVDMANITAKLVARCLVDADGKRLFGDTDEDIATVGKIRGDLLNRLYTVAQRLSGLSEEDMQELGKRSANQVGTSSSSA